jgi:hypothetical protein
MGAARNELSEGARALIAQAEIKRDKHRNEEPEKLGFMAIDAGKNGLLLDSPNSACWPVQD